MQTQSQQTLFAMNGTPSAMFRVDMAWSGGSAPFPQNTFVWIFASRACCEWHNLA